jgi:hypothetical protein
MSQGDLKRLIRSKLSGLDWGTVHIVAVYDKMAFEKVVGISFDTLAAVGKYRTCTRDPAMVRERYAETGHLFVRHLMTAYNEYNNTTSVSLHRSKEADLNKFWVFADSTPSYGAMFHGKPITEDELCELGQLLYLLKNGELGRQPIHLWEERYERRAVPSEFTFLEDAIQEAAEDVITKDRKTLANLAFYGAMQYVPCKDWPCTSYDHRHLANTFAASGTFSTAFLETLDAVLKLEYDRHGNDDEEEKNTREFTQKIWKLLEREVGTDLTTACRDATKYIYDVRDEFLHLAYGPTKCAMLLAEASQGRSTRMRVGGQEKSISMTDVLSEWLKSYTPKNPLFQKTANP